MDPPVDSSWIVTGYWKSGTAQRNDAPFGDTASPLSDPESRVVDHFGAEGASRSLKFFDGLLDPATRKLLRQNGGSIFEDSLELKHTQGWTPGFIEAFEDVNGYSVLPYLPTLPAYPATSPFAEPALRYGFASEQREVVERAPHDVEQTVFCTSSTTSRRSESGPTISACSFALSRTASPSTPEWLPRRSTSASVRRSAAMSGSSARSQEMWRRPSPATSTGHGRHRGPLSPIWTTTTAGSSNCCRPAKRTGLSVHALLYYEREDLLIGSVRRTAGRPTYTAVDVDWLGVCVRLRESGMPLADLRKFAALVSQGSGNEKAD